MELALKDKIVIVTGGAAGIGRATADRFRAEGAIAIPWDITTEPRIDVTKRESVERAVEDVIRQHGRIDVLVNNAGILRDAQLVKWKDGADASAMDDATFDAAINVHLRGDFIVTRDVIPHLVRMRRRDALGRRRRSRRHLIFKSTMSECRRTAVRRCSDSAPFCTSFHS